VAEEGDRYKGYCLDSVRRWASNADTYLRRTTERSRLSASARCGRNRKQRNAEVSEDQIEKLKNESPEKLVKLARATGRSDKQIVLDLTYLATKEGVASAARKFAPALGMTTAQFKILAGPR